MTIIVRAIISVLLITGGISALVFGFILLTRELNQQGTAIIRLGPFEANATGTGAVVMITACLWGVASAWAAPGFIGPDGTEVSSANDPDTPNIQFDEADPVFVHSSTLEEGWPSWNPAPSRPEDERLLTYTHPSRTIFLTANVSGRPSDSELRIDVGASSSIRIGTPALLFQDNYLVGTGEVTAIDDASSIVTPSTEQASLENAPPDTVILPISHSNGSFIAYPDEQGDDSMLP